MRNDEKTRGMDLATVVSLAISEPGEITPRQQKAFGGAETVKEWQLRATWQVLRDRGVDLSAVLPVVATRPQPRLEASPAPRKPCTPCERSGCAGDHCVDNCPNSVTAPRLSGGESDA